MSESLGWCVEAVRAAAEPSLSRALQALRGRHTRRAGGPARFRERGGLGPLLELVGPERPRRVLELALSVLGNCCTEPGCRRQARSLGGVPRLVSILAVPNVPEGVAGRAARALANLALEAPGAREVLEAGAAPLLISLASSCTSPTPLLNSARALRILCPSPTPQTPPPPSLPLPHRALAVSTLSSRLSLLSPCHPCCPLLLRSLRALVAPPCPGVVAEGATPALEVLVNLGRGPEESRGAALAVLAALSAQGRLRPKLGELGVVEVVVEAVRRQFESGGSLPPQFESGVRALCLLCREAVNRARVRRCGGLGALLGILREPRAGRWHRRALLALAAFAWDPLALGRLGRAGLVPLLARGLRGEGRGGEGLWGEGMEMEMEEEEEEGEEEEAASVDWPRERRGRALLGALGAAAAAPFGLGLLRHGLSAAGTPRARAAAAAATALLAR
ncbi:armadillo repeat-containing protein 5 [Catharus ustulatus]|uniref:armadillo repeat-containing protein 5 n=1 Tax=Catharus ustulatus TaxID=91951 RepID=UPI001407761F|nr:armadillo repeat-containing protein 5 [Catharus ustulatus]